MKFNNEVVLRDSDHCYLTQQGEIINLPSATALVGLIFPFPVSEIDPNVLKLGQERGNHLHKNMELYITLGIDSQCCEIKSHAYQFVKGKQMWNQLVVDLELVNIHSELPLYNKYYCGTIDVVAFSNKLNGWVIIDFKTTSWKIATTREKQEEILAKESLQLYLYSQLMPELNVKNFYIINTNKGQCYKLDDYHMRQAKWNYDWIIKYLKNINKSIDI